MSPPKPPGGGCAEQEAQEAQRGHKDQKSDQIQVHQVQDLNASQAVPQPHPKISPPQAGSSESSATLIVCSPSFCSCAYYCILFAQVAGFSKFFQRISGDVTVQEDDKEAGADCKQILTTADPPSDTLMWPRLLRFFSCFDLQESKVIEKEVVQD